MAIQQLIAETGAHVEGGLVSVDPKGDEVQAAWEDLKSPETYLGYERTESFASPGGASLGRVGAARRAAGGFAHAGGG